MDHLEVLGDAGLVTTRRDRRKLHFLNPVPIRLIHDRSIRKYAEPRVEALPRPETELEDTMNDPIHVDDVFINAPATVVWQAIISGDQTERYYYGTRVESTWEPGAPVRYVNPDGSVAADGEIIRFEPARRLELTFVPRWDPALAKDGTPREVWILDEVNGMTRVTVETHDISPDSATAKDFASGGSYILSGLKTFVETGKSLPSPH